MVRLTQTWAIASRAPVVRGAKMLTYVQFLVASRSFLHRCMLLCSRCFIQFPAGPRETTQIVRAE